MKNIIQVESKIDIDFFINIYITKENGEKHFFQYVSDDLESLKKEIFTFVDLANEIINHNEINNVLKLNMDIIYLWEEENKLINMRPFWKEV
ncbi:MAG: hypothetical protein WC942_08660 [Clostridia bacterium]|jgi:hypothetical protein